MRYRLFLLLYCCFTFASIAQQNQLIGLDHLPDEWKNAPAIIHESIQEVTVDASGKFTVRKKLRATILKTDANSLAVLSVPYSKSIKVKNISGEATDLLGKSIYKFKKSDIQDYSNFSSFSVYEDNRVKVLDIQQHKLPYTVSFDYELEYPNLYYIPSWIPQPYTKIPVQKTSIRYSIPSDKTVRFFSKTIADDFKSEKKEGDKIVYAWEMRDLSPVKVEPLASRDSQSYYHLLASPAEFVYDGFAGKLNSWEEMGAWFYQLNQGKRELPQKTIDEVKQLTAGLGTDMDKIQALYQYMQNKTRYVSIQLGLGGLMPFDAMNIEKNGFGDCKALSNYMGALLDVVGIENYYTLIHGGASPRKTYPEFTADYFNHVILAVPQKDGEYLFLECTDQNNPFGYLSDFTSDRYALLITPEGGKLVHTPKYGYAQNIQIHKASFSISESGDVQGTIQLVAKALQAENNRLLEMGRAREQDKKKWAQSMYKLSSMTVQDYTFDVLPAPIPEASFEASIQAKNFGSPTGNRLFFQPNQFNTLRSSLTSTENRTTDFEIVVGFIDEDEFNFTFPQGYSVENLPKSISIETSFGYFKNEYQLHDTGLVLRRKVEMRDGVYEASLFKEYVSFLSLVEQADKAKIVLKRN